MLAIRQLRRLKAEARDVAGLVKLVQVRQPDVDSWLAFFKPECIQLFQIVYVLIAVFCIYGWKSH